MKDEYKRECWKQYGLMWDKKCPCCNWTLRKNKRKYVRMINKSAKAKIKARLRDTIKEPNK